MKKNFILFVCLGICLHVAAQSDVANAKYMHVTVDGNSKEWGSLNFYDEETQLNFAIANDADNIYLCFVTGSQAAQMKLMRAGMKITLSSKGKPKREAAVAFPLPQTVQHDSAAGKNNVASAPGTQPVLNKENFRQNYIAHHTSMQVTGFANANGEIPANGTGLHAAVNWDSSSNMVYEIAIAKNEFYGANYTAKDLKSDITLNVELNALSKAETGDAKYAKAHAGDMEDGDKHEGGMHDGKLRPGVGFNTDKRPESITDPGDKNSMNQKTSFKQKFILADSQDN